MTATSIALDESMLRAVATQAFPGPGGRVEIGGSIYAAPPELRVDAAALLASRGLWVHADLIARSGRNCGVDLDTLRRIRRDGSARLDVHLIGPADDVSGLLEEVCRIGADRVTVQVEAGLPVGEVAGRIRAAGAVPWLALAPTTPVAHVTEHLLHVAGVLLLLITPGTLERAQPARVRAAHDLAGVAIGLDGGVDQALLAPAAAAGVDYLVIGRALWRAPGTAANTGPSGCPSTDTSQPAGDPPGDSRGHA